MSTDTPPTTPPRGTRRTAAATKATADAAKVAVPAPPTTSAPSAGDASASDASAELAVLRAEVARLRELVGPDEVAYTKLKTELWKARDAAMGAELAAGTLRGRVQALESQLVRVTRQTRWLKRLMISPVRRAKDFVRTI